MCLDNVIMYKYTPFDPNIPYMAHDYEHFHELITTDLTDAQQTLIHRNRLLRMPVVMQC